MILADWIALIVLVLFAVLGALLGFGKGLKIFTYGIFGVVISVFICYCFGGMILKFSFMQDLLAKFASLWAGKDGLFYDLLSKIRLEVIIYYILLFVVVQMLRAGIIAIIKHVAEVDVLAVKIVNRILGIVLFVGMAVLLSLAVFQFISWVGGSTAQKFAEMLSDSAFNLDEIFMNNPLCGLIEVLHSL